MDPSRAADDAAEAPVRDPAGAPLRDPAEARLRAAARAVLDADGRDHVLQPWQVAYLVALTEGHEAVAPPGCGVGKGWLQARLDEAATEALA